MYYECPNEALNRYIKNLNRKKLSGLLEFSCFISLIDFFDCVPHGYNLFAPILNVESINLFDQVLVLSKSREYKDEYISSRDFKLYYNLWLDIVGFRQKYIESINGTKEEGFERQLLSMINNQVRFQSNLLKHRYNRALLFYEIIPDKYKNILKSKTHEYVDIPRIFFENYNLTISDFLFNGFIIFSFYLNRLDLLFPQNVRESMREFISKSKHYPFDRDNLECKFQLFMGIYTKNIMKRSHLFFDVDKLIPNKENEALDKNKAKRYLELTSLTMREIINLRNNNDVYKSGIILDRLSPFERYPIILVEKYGYIVPNFRYFEISITELIHYMMQKLFPNNEYNQTLGYIQEIYISQILGECFGNEKIIPEIEYKRKTRFGIRS